MLELILANRSYLLQIIVIFVSTVLIYLHVLKHQKEELHKFPLLSNPDLVVAQDGSGNFRMVSAAVAAAHSHSKYLFVIHIKAGVYTEIVKVGIDKTNLACVGNGIDQTIVTFNGTTADGTFESGETATLYIRGNGFMAMNLTFVSSAIREGRAMALRTAANQLTFYRCSIKGHMHTLSAQWGEQFFRDCDIYGTSSIISGDAIAVFQNCNIIALEPSPGQTIVLFVQGRKSTKRESGFFFQSCNISPGVRSTAEAYLGQPLEALSRVVIMQSYIARLISPAGWLDSPSNYSHHINTAYLGEYENKGRGWAEKMTPGGQGDLLTSPTNQHSIS